MKRVIVLALTGATVLTTSTVFAGRDEIQKAQSDRAIAAKRAEQAAEAQRGLAGPVGPEGKPGPAATRNPPGTRPFPGQVKPGY